MELTETPMPRKFVTDGYELVERMGADGSPTKEFDVWDTSGEIRQHVGSMMAETIEDVASAIDGMHEARVGKVEDGGEG